MNLETQLSNVCLETCTAACCRNMVFSFLSLGELRRLVASTQPRQTPAGLTSEFLLSSSAFPNGIYFKEVEGDLEVALKGLCPNLLSDGRCGIYKRSTGACENLSVGSPECLEARRVEGLEPLSITIG